jgi:predicted neuraminidase
MRDSGDDPARVHTSESKDNGETWQVSTKTAMPNTASVELLVLQDGRWAFLGNDIDDGRYRIGLFLSDNEGKTWNWKAYLEKVEPNKGSFSYPSLIQTTDGLLHITYSYHLEKDKKSIKYVVVNPHLILIN